MLYVASRCQVIIAAHGFQLFLKGTGLDQLREEYRETERTVKKTMRILKAKEEDLQDLVKKRDAAKRKVDLAQRAEDEKAQRDRLLAEKAWGLVENKQKVGIPCNSNSKC
jgi:hypothetical protein